MSLKKCSSCGFESLEQKKITHTLFGGNNTAIVEAYADVCEHCGEILFTLDQVRIFEAIKEKLEKNQTDSFIPIGKTYKVA